MNILGITNFYTSLDPLCPQAIQKPAEILMDKGYNIVMISPKPYTNFLLNFISAKWRSYSLIKNRSIAGIKVMHPQFIEFPRNISKHTAWKRYLKAIAKLISDGKVSFKPNIIHAHMCYPDGVAAKYIANKMRIPFVVTIRGTDLITMENFPSIRSMMLKTLSEANKVIFPSLRISNQFHNLYKYSQSNTEIVPNGINVDDFDFDPPTVPDHLKGHTIIVSVCNLDKNKGVDINLMALSLVLKKNDNIHYIIVGDGKERNDLEIKVDNLNIRKYVTFVGRLSHKEALKYISICDIFSLPAWRETFGLVYLEAMFLKKPIIATFDDGIDGSAKDQVHGFFAHRENVNEVANAILKLVENPILRKEMGERGHLEVTNNYTWECHAAKINRIYTEL